MLADFHSAHERHSFSLSPVHPRFFLSPFHRRFSLRPAYERLSPSSWNVFHEHPQLSPHFPNPSQTQRGKKRNIQIQMARRPRYMSHSADKKAHKDIQNHGCCSKPELCDLVLFAIVPPPLSTLMTLDVQEIRCQGENLATWYFTGQCIVASLYGEFFFITFSVLVIFSL